MKEKKKKLPTHSKDNGMANKVKRRNKNKMQSISRKENRI